MAEEKKAEKISQLPNYYVATVSWGKDSCAMLEVILANLKKYPLHLVLFINTGMEFEAVYSVRDKVLQKLSKLRIPYVEIDISVEFSYYMFQHVIRTHDGSEKVGYKWCGGACRWGTALKLQKIAAYIKKYLFQYNVYEYVGYAADEQHRVPSNDSTHKIYPLIEEGIKEALALQICYRNGYLYEENGVFLYEILDRLSCWCCSNKNLKELRAYYYLLPHYFVKLKLLQMKMPDFPFKGERGSVFDLEQRFLAEGGRQQSIFDDIVCIPLMEKEGGRKIC